MDQFDASVLERPIVRKNGSTFRTMRYVVDCADLDEALEIARELGAADPGGAYEIRPIGVFCPGRIGP